MNKTGRLFDFLDVHRKNRPDRVMLAGKENGKWRTYSAGEVAQLVENLSAGLLKMGLGPGDFSAEGRDKIAVIAKNRPEWVILDLAVQRIGAILVPVYPTISTGELEFVLKDSAVKMIFVNDGHLAQKVREVQPQLPQLTHMYSFDVVEDVPVWRELCEGVSSNTRERVTAISERITPQHLATIIYTSGTTGKPKGVMLSHNNIYSNVLDSMPCFPPGGENMIALSFLPLNHIFEKMVTYLYLFKGTSIYYAESMETIADNLREIKPHLFTTVPRLLEKVYEKIMVKGLELRGLKRSLFFWAHSLAKKYEINQPMGFFYNMQLALANKIIFSKWREALGNRIVCIISGGAACQVRLIRIFTAAKIVVMEGYGLTETSPVISVNRYEEQNRMFGTVGPLIDNVAVKIAEDGEILCKGPNVMVGYYKNQDLTESAFTDDGWFKTGDIGTLVNNRFLKITDRKKEIFKTSGGKYVAPGVLENSMKESPYIEHIMVIGEGEKYVSALIVPAFENLTSWCREREIPATDRDEMVNNPQVRRLFREIIDAKNEAFGKVEKIKQFVLLTKDWGIESGELTPKLSMRRKHIFSKYQKEIQSIYQTENQR